MVDYKKIGALAASGVVVFGLGGLAGAALFPQTVETPVEVPYEVIVEVPVEVPVVEYVEVPFEVPVEVSVDNGNLDEVLEYVYEYGLEDLDVEDLDSDEIDQIVDRIVFLNDAREYARVHVDNNFLSIIDRLRVDGVRIDRDDVERVRLGDVDEFVVRDIDFDFSDVTVEVPVEFVHDDDSLEAIIIVEFKDGEIVEAELA